VSCLLRNNGALYNRDLTNFRAKLVDVVLTLTHNSHRMMAATTKTTTKTKPSGGSGGVRA
jgi:hypothetical protein